MINLSTTSYGIAGTTITALIKKKLQRAIFNPVSVIPNGMSMETLAKRLATISQCFEQLEEFKQLRHLDIATADFEEHSADIATIIDQAQVIAGKLPVSGFVQAISAQKKDNPFPTNKKLAETFYEVLMEHDCWPDLFMILGIVAEPIDTNLFQILQANNEWQTSTDYCLKLYRNFKHLQGRMNVYAKFSDDDLNQAETQETISKI